MSSTRPRKSATQVPVIEPPVVVVPNGVYDKIEIYSWDFPRVEVESHRYGPDPVSPDAPEEISDECWESLTMSGFLPDPSETGQAALILTGPRATEARVYSPYDDVTVVAGCGSPTPVEVQPKSEIDLHYPKQ